MAFSLVELYEVPGQPLAYMTRCLWTVAQPSGVLATPVLCHLKVAEGPILQVISEGVKHLP